MSHFLYRRPDGHPEVSSHQLALALFPGYEFCGEFEQPPSLAGMELDASGALVPSMQHLKQAKKVQVEKVRDLRVSAPLIVYDGKNLDADAASIDRLAKKLAALQAYEMKGETMPPEMLVWRDADNITHSFASHQEYKVWLAGLAVALDARGTAAFAWSWEKKALIDQAETCGELDAISLES